MTHEEDCCFQSQESGHIACHCLNVCCFECNEYGHIVVDCPHQIPPSGTLACHHRPKSHTRHHTRSTSHHCHQDRYRHSRSRSQSLSCRYCSHSHHGSYRQHSRSHPRDSRCHHRSTSQCPHSSTYHSCCDTPHHRLSSHQSSSGYSQDHSRPHSCSAYKPSKTTMLKSSSHPSRTPGNLHDKRNSRVTIEEPEMNLYSSHDNFSDSEDDQNHLN